jgi:Ca2+-dependent lipid-binding protein
MGIESGVLILQVISGQLAKKGSLEVTFDDSYWPCFTSARTRSTHQNWDEVSLGIHEWDDAHS